MVDKILSDFVFEKLAQIIGVYIIFGSKVIQVHFRIIVITYVTHHFIDYLFSAAFRQVGDVGANLYNTLIYPGVQ
jgi:hypothetical protein